MRKSYHQPRACSRRGRIGVRPPILLTALALTLPAAAPAWANLVITPTFDSSITGDPNAASIEGTINTAISGYETLFADPINVAIKFQEGGGLGGSSTFFANVSYSTFLTALNADKTTAADATALSLLFPGGPNNPVNGDPTINVKTANLRAVGINVNPPAGQPDGTITLNTSLTFPGSPSSSLQYSLLSVTQHEIDEVLGLGSSLPGVPFDTIFPEDLYRYDASGNRSFTTSSSAKAFFSIDGVDDLAQFDNQNDGGDFGDWQSNPLPAERRPAGAGRLRHAVCHAEPRGRENGPRRRRLRPDPADAAGSRAQRADASRQLAIGVCRFPPPAGITPRQAPGRRQAGPEQQPLSLAPERGDP